MRSHHRTLILHADDYQTEMGESGLDESEVLDLVSEGRRASVIADVVGHPEGAPSLTELEYMNPNMGRESIVELVRGLVDAGIFEELTASEGAPSDESPGPFYRLTPESRELFDKNGLYPKNAWRRQYERVEKPPEIRELERLPRPS